MWLLELSAKLLACVSVSVCVRARAYFLKLGTKIKKGINLPIGNQPLVVTATRRKSERRLL